MELSHNPIEKYVLLMLAAFLLTGCSRQPEFVTDGAKLFSAEQKGRITEFHSFLLADHDIDYRIATLAESAGDINAYAGRQFSAIGTGSASQGGRGLLLVIDAAGNQVRLEVSRALESVYPDAFIAYIEQRQMTEFFAAGRIADGILAATELIITRAQRAQANQGWDDEVWSQASTSGGGATAFARLGKADRLGEPDRTVGSVQQSPEETVTSDPPPTLQQYLQAMSARNANPELGIYSAESRAMLRQWVVTPAQMDSIVKAYRDCHAESARYNPDQTLAVIRYPLEQRACPPWFFVRDGGMWQLDLSGAQRYIRFGRDNSWHFDWRVLERHPYQFAFTDWGFDNRGFPQKMRWNLTAASDKDGNVWVSRIGAGSAAESFGFQPNDRLLKWNGIPLHHHQQLMRAMREVEPGAQVAVDIIRGGTPMTLAGVAPPLP